FAAAKKSRCRPAQGRRVKRANESRMPAKAKAKAKEKQKSKSKSKSKRRIPAKTQTNPPSNHR
ncbi:hypothetical protein, partial [Paraburkholderia caribensis]|uniref:hypothetical protein n=1 Tax=Paraburkholderia caribensis TaxID=75105 RepID=UPI0020907751